MGERRELDRVESLGDFGALREVPRERGARQAPQAGRARVIEIPHPDGFFEYASLDGAGVRGGKILELDLPEDVLEAMAGQGGDVAAKFALGAMPALERKLIGHPTDVVQRWSGSGWDTEPAGEGASITLLLHGTWSSPEGSFGPLLDEGLLTQRPVYALRHRTMGASPVANAIAAVEALPKGARLHLLSQSRGGLVGELLCRGIIDGAREDAKAYLARQTELPEARALLEQLTNLDKLLAEKDIRVERFVRVACPAGGTSLAGDRLPKVLSVFLGAIGWAAKALGAPALDLGYRFAKAAVLGIVAHGTKAEHLPGLAAMRCDGPLVRALAATRRNPAPLAPVGVALAARGPLRALALHAARLVFPGAHDLVVDTRSMLGGMPREGEPRGWIEQSTDTWHLSYFGKGAARDAILRALDGHEEPIAWSGRSAARALRSQSGGSRGRLYIVPDAGGSHLRSGGELVWPDPGRLLRDPAIPEALEPAQLDPIYLRLEERARELGFEVVPRPYAPGASTVDIPDERGARVIAHGLGAALVPEALRARTLVLGAGPDRRQREAMLAARLVELGCNKEHAGRLLRGATEVPGTAKLDAVVLGRDDAHQPGAPRSRATHADLPRDPQTLDAIAGWLLGGALDLPRSERSPRPAPSTTTPLGRIPDAADLVRAALGANDVTPEHAQLRAGVIHGSLRAARPAPREHFAWVVPLYSGEPLGPDVRELDRTVFGGAVERLARAGALPAAGQVIPVFGPKGAGALLGLGSSHSLGASALAAGVARSIATLDALVPREGRAAIAIRALGSEPGEALGLEEAATAMVQGAAEAASAQGAGLDLYLSERHEDRAVRVARALASHAAAGARVDIAEPPLERRDGYRGARALDLPAQRRWARWSVAEARAPGGGAHLAFRVDDGRAALLVVDHALPRVPPERLAGVLVPPDLRDAAGARDVIVELDRASATLPWEEILLDDGTPLAVRHGLVRQLRGGARAGAGRSEPLDRTAIVIGDPFGGGGELPGARRESSGVARTLELAGFAVRRAIGGRATQGLDALLGTPTQILHVAAHGTSAGGGAVEIGEGYRLDEALVRTLRAAPMVVFLSSCDAGAVGALPSLAEAFLERGCRAFIGACRPIDDREAVDFANELYGAMIAGRTLGDALRLARASLAARGSRVWSAYQAWGDPDLTLRVRAAEAVGGSCLSENEIVDAVTSILGDARTEPIEAREDLLDRLAALDASVPQRLRTGRVEERLASAWRDLGQLERAIEGYERALIDRTSRADTAEARADLLLRTGKEAAAKQILEHVVAIRPHAWEPRRLFAMALLATGSHDDGLREYERARDLAAGERGERLRVAAEHALVCFALGRQMPPLDCEASSRDDAARDRIASALATYALALSEGDPARIRDTAAALDAAAPLRATDYMRRSMQDFCALLAQIAAPERAKTMSLEPSAREREKESRG